MGNFLNGCTAKDLYSLDKSENLQILQAKLANILDNGDCQKTWKITAFKMSLLGILIC